MVSRLPAYAYDMLRVFYGPNGEWDAPLDRTVDMLMSLFGDINCRHPSAEEALKIRDMLVYLLEGNQLGNRRARCTAALELLLARKLNLPA